MKPEAPIRSAGKGRLTASYSSHREQTAQQVNHFYRTAEIAQKVFDSSFTRENKEPGEAAVSGGRAHSNFV
jgi:hypothetical protein